uniref:CSON012698 protein n=1 Tax=Culicoides sonorensis TaxID=179676 RepID=A0A336KKG1_CULSO
MNADQCRVCLTFGGELKSIFKEGKILNEIVTLSTLLHEILTVEVSKNDGLPSFMCTKCILRLVKALTFKRDCLKVYETFSANVNKEGNEYQEKCTENWTLATLDEDADNIELIEIDAKEDVLLEDIDCPDIEDEDLVHDNTTDITETPNTIEFRRYKPRSDKKQKFGYQCQICRKILSKLSSYNYHMDLHSDVEKYQCDQCDARFKTKNAYTGHLATHSGMYKCENCDKSYRQLASLKTHMLSHNQTTAKPFICNICDKDFTQKSGLKKHLLTHSDLKMFKCTEENCGKEFRYSSNYYVHLKSHRGEKNFECDVCSKKFSSKEQTKRHKLIHTGEKPFVCDVCNRAFNRKSALTIHMGIHEKVKKYRCVKCDKGFNQPQGLKTHSASCN